LLEHIGWTVADFDGDNQPDLAITQTQGRGYLLQFELSRNREGGAPRTLFPPLPSAFGLHLTPRDVDGDHDLDIVITSGFARQPVAVWINDGQGRFQEGDLTAYPSATGRGDLSLSSQSLWNRLQPLFSPNRRLLFRIAPRAGWFHPDLGSRPIRGSRPESLI